MLKIALISEHASPLAHLGGVDSGGQNVYVSQVAEMLVQRGAIVDVFTRREETRSPDEVWRNGVRVIHVPAGPPALLPKEALLAHMVQFGNFLEGYFAAERERGEPYHVVHANFFMSAMAGRIVAQRFGLPLVVTFHALGRVRRLHQQQADGFPDERFAIEDDIVRHADRIIAECPQDRADLISLYRAEPRRLAMIPCGFDSAEMSPLEQGHARAELGWQKRPFTLLQLGRMVPRKGVDNVIRALRVLRSEHGVDVNLCVVGGNSNEPCEVATPELRRLRAVARAEGVAPYVDFVGRRDRLQLRAYYCAADVFVTTPWYEPFGITPVEAMACARPVVGSDTGGIRYSIKDGVTGFLVDPHSPGDLAAKLALLAADPALCRRMGAAGMRRARQKFTWRHVGDQLLDVYAELCPNAAPSRAPLHSSPLMPARAIA
jgi:D-inositol-3-phosphate glycosyltransferase